jgi:L-rhamnose isomerase / sugar isomerase
MQLQANPRDADYIRQSNLPLLGDLESDYAALGRQLARRSVAIDSVVKAVAAFGVAIPSWGVGTGGTRFARFTRSSTTAP